MTVIAIGIFYGQNFGLNWSLPDDAEITQTAHLILVFGITIFGMLTLFHLVEFFEELRDNYVEENRNN